MKTHSSFPSNGTTVRPSRPAVKSCPSLVAPHHQPTHCLKSGSCSHHQAPHAGKPSTSGSPAPLPSPPSLGIQAPYSFTFAMQPPKLAHPSLPPNPELLLLPLSIPRSIPQFTLWTSRLLNPTGPWSLHAKHPMLYRLPISSVEFTI